LIIDQFLKDFYKALTIWSGLYFCIFVQNHLPSQVSLSKYGRKKMESLPELVPVKALS